MSRAADRRSASAGESECRAFRDGVHIAQRQPRFVREVFFEQAMRAHDLQRQALAFRRQVE
jgi:hypothetical protein